MNQYQSTLRRRAFMPKNLFTLPHFMLLLVGLLSWNCYGAEVMVKAPTKVYFSPNSGGGPAVINEIAGAKSEVLLQAPAFTSSAIAKVLGDVHQRGVEVQVILDKNQRKRSGKEIAFLTNLKIPVYLDGNHAIAGNRVIIIDKSTVITGSFSFTDEAEEKHAGNLLVIKSKDLAAHYRDNWLHHRDHSAEQKTKKTAHRTAAPRRRA